MLIESSGSDPAEPLVVERFYDRDLSGRHHALGLFGAILGRFLSLASFSLFLVPLTFGALLTIDVPLRMFDRLFGLPPSSFLSVAEGFWMLALFAAILLTRRLGAETGGRVVTVAWVFSAALFAMILFDLSAELVPEDFPPMRLASALLAGWLFGHWLGVWAYQLTRGGAWWRAPFIGGVTGTFVMVLIYYPGAYAGTGVTWGWWMAITALLGTGASGFFVGVYGLLRRLIVPRSGLGGR